MSNKAGAGLAHRASTSGAAAADPNTDFFRCYLERAGARVPERNRVRKAKFKFPVTCSIFDDPESALGLAVDIAQAVVAGTSGLWFDQSRSVQVDLCAESLTAALAKKARDAYVHVDGKYPEEPDARSCVAGFGTPAVLKEFGFEPSWDVPLVLLERHDVDEKIRTASLSREEPGFKAARIPVLIERQFGNFVLKAQFADKLIQFLIAATENALEHGNGEWWMASSFRKLADPAWGKCQITIFNLGDSIYEKLIGLPSDSPIRATGEGYVRSQRNFFNRNWSEEGVWTLLALQKEVTHRPGSMKGRGFLGMLKLLDYAIETCPAGYAPRMSILSGHTHLLLDGRYRYDEAGREGKPPMIALNHANDLAYPPNPAAARTLRNCFPGTMVSIQFYVSAHEHLNPVLVSNGHSSSSEERRAGSFQAHAVGGARFLRRRVG